MESQDFAFLLTTKMLRTWTTRETYEYQPRSQSQD